MTKDQYAERAMTLIQSPVVKGILGYKNAKGQVARFDTETGDFVKGHPDKGIATMFKPARGKEYFDDWKQRRIGLYVPYVVSIILKKKTSTKCVPYVDGKMMGFSEIIPTMPAAQTA